MRSGRTLQRGIVALAIVTSLSIAGARPAAAMDLGLMRQISHLWSFFLGGPSPAPRQTTGKPVHRKGSSSNCPSGTTCEGGWGIDPNGNTVNSAPATTDSGV
jgi:hypothetical protein